MRKQELNKVATAATVEAATQRRQATRRVKMIDGNGRAYWWSFYYGKFVNVGINRRKMVSGWGFIDHEGYNRFQEGNWLDFVPYFKQTADNYGFTTTLS